MRKLLLLLLCGSCAAQIVIGGTTKIGGKTVISVPGAITPPPPPGLSEQFIRSSWNHTPPSVWAPTDSQHNNATINGARMHDNGVKLGQIFTCNGTTCSPSGAFNGSLKTFMQTTLPQYPMDVLYTFSDTPAGAAMSPGTDAKCANPGTNSCVPFSDSDSNTATCNAHPNPNGTDDAAVIANCGNGSNAQFMSMVYQLLTAYNFQGVECWNEPDGAGNFWSNSATYGGVGNAPSHKNQPPLVRLVAMCNIVQKIANAIDPTIKVYSPSFHGPTAQTWMNRYSNTQVNDPGCNAACGSHIGGITWAGSTVLGKNTFTVTTAHVRGSGSGTGEGPANARPEAFITQWANVLAELNADHLPGCVSDDEWGPVNQATPPQSGTVDYLAYYVAAGLLLRASVNTPNCSTPGIWNEYYYQWDAPGGGGNQALQGNVAGTAWDIVGGWIIGSTISAATNVGNTWTVPIVSSGGISEKAVWSAASLTINTAAVSTAIGGNTVYQCSGNCSGLAGEFLAISGYANGNNNGSFTVQSSTIGSVTVNNPSGVADPAGSGVGTYAPATCGTSCATQPAGGFGHWTDLTGTAHVVSGGVVPVGAKPILLTP